MVDRRDVAVLCALTVLVACASDEQASHPPRTAAQSTTLTTESPTITPQSIPTRPCSATIYSGIDSQAVVAQPSDFVIGPVRLATLLDTGPRREMWHEMRSGGRDVAVLKIPLTVAAVDAPSVVIRINAPDQSAGLLYDDASTTALQSGQLGGLPQAVEVQSAVPCGKGSNGFVQYNGGFVATRPSCAVLEVVDSTGETLGNAPVALERSC